jgi:hypothetical protein
MTDDIYPKISTKKNEFADLWARMDADKSLLILDKYTMLDREGRDEPDVDNITMNDPAVFAQKVHNTLIHADITPEVSGKELKDDAAEIIENFIKDISIEADSFVAPRDMPSYKEWETMQACDRGRVARRVTLTVEDGTLSPESFLNLDTRYLWYDTGIRGLNWVATETLRSREDIEDEYNFKCPGANSIVTDYWDSTIERVYIGKRQADNDMPHKYGEPPFVIQTMPTGIFTFDSDRMLTSGESILSINRNLYDKKNLFATILNSGVVKSFFNGLQLEVEDVRQAKKPEIPPYRKKIVAPVEKGTKGYFAMPINDLTNNARMFYSILDSALQDGAFPKISYGTLQFPVSAVGIASLKESEDPVYFPRLQGITLFYQRLFRMIIKQYIQQKLNISIGEEGFKTKFNYKDLNKEYAIKFKVFISSPKQDMVNISTAAAVGGLVSDDTKRRDYLHLENPTDEKRKLLVETANKMSPAIAKYDVIISLIQEGEEVKADIMAHELGLTLDQIKKGDMSVTETPILPTEKPQQPLPLFQGSGTTAPPETPPLSGSNKEPSPAEIAGGTI